MSKSLAELRQSEHTSLPERTYPICLAQKLVAQVNHLVNEQAELEVEDERDAGGEPKSNKRASDGPNPRIEEIRVELESLYDLMREHTGDLLIRAVDSGTWTRWTQDHPARTDEDDQGKIIARDLDISRGYCNGDDLIADLGAYVVAHNGKPLGPGDWDFIKGTAAPGDLKEIARWVVQMHEVTGAVPKSRSGSSASPKNETA